MVVTAKKDPEVEPESTTADASAEETQADDSEDVDAPAEDDEDDGDEQTDEDEDDEDNVLLKSKRTTARRPKRPWRQYFRRGILPVLLIASLAVSGFLGWKQWQEHQVNLAGQQAQQAAVAYAQVLTSIDSNKVDENFRQVLDGATGEFKDMYTQSSVQLRQLLIDNKQARTAWSSTRPFSPNPRIRLSCWSLSTRPWPTRRHPNRASTAAESR